MSRTKVNDLLNDISRGIEYIENDIKCEDFEELKLDFETLKDDVNDIKYEFEEYSDEVADIENDLEGLVKRLSEGCK